MLKLAKLLLKSPVERFIFMSPELVYDWLNSQHDHFISQMQSKFQTMLSRSVAKDSVEERHKGRFDTDIGAIDPCAFVQVVDYTL